MSDGPNNYEVLANHVLVARNDGTEDIFGQPALFSPRPHVPSFLGGDIVNDFEMLTNLFRVAGFKGGNRGKGSQASMVKPA